MIATKIDEFIRLFQEFANSYPNTSHGITHTAAYAQQREIGCRNFRAIDAAVRLNAKKADSGEDVTESILLQLLPYSENINNRHLEAWIYTYPAIKDIKEWLEKVKITVPKDWKQIGLSFFHFVRRCNANPKELSAACTEFTQLPHSKSFRIEIITPILNALQPDKFLLVTNKSRKVINYFANTAYTSKLIDYPALNSTGHELIGELCEYMHQSGVPALRDDDLFDMFSHWLVAIKKDPFYHEKAPSNDKYKDNDLNINSIELQTEYTLSKCAEDTGISEIKLQSWIRSIHRKKQAIIYGSPGTGKTFIAEKIAKCLISGSDGFSELVQFHPAYTYEDFIQGIRPQSKNGKLTYPLLPGCFIKFCHQAETREGICTFIIDEINRANIAQVFGELMYLLEYRDKEIPLAAGNTFCIPENVRIIGTMNTADRSIAEFDYALRRRFAFIELRPNYQILRKRYADIDFPIDKLIDVLQRINQVISDKNYEIGISFFITDNLLDDIEDIWRMEIEPYLEEYFFNQLEKVDEFRWNKLQLL
ncbi:MAG: AAA family ATPase [Rivularia sp. (in: cyanobacteria)]